MDNIGCKVIVSGIVQGVGFRYFTAAEARLYHIMGHAKNLASGDVEVLMYGERAKIAKMVKWLEKGPKTSRVSGITVTEVPYVERRDFVTR
ncbi:acylphosphatase [Psychromonas sp.]|uniref:acylphosphatase n=1 Tax=Psychromonas sp. TaxID=1884585 RepID=UPI0035682AFB